MLLLLFISMLLTSFEQSEGSPTYQEEYRNDSYVPNFMETPFGYQIVAPASPYVAAAGRNHLYFIDTRYDDASAQHIKNQIERASIPIPNEYTAIDEITATAEIRNGKTGETTFVFDPAYARVFFAKGINKRNPDIKLSEHESVGNWLVAYDVDKIIDTYISAGNNDLTSHVVKRVHAISAMKTESTTSVTLAANVLGSCIRFCTVVDDTPREEDETDVEYYIYARMNKLHWQ
ncbi:hypothetical protein N7493_011350 [Penicillium malachiteum]|uniref:Ankyrin repeat-containing protein n=1 Tax=Penicillium malachiteum TaxID=1324776 RepID=A0AAD6MR98_9EURO|nr:hypothetical protein N7493_011350 [Penicillium malachiteum]